MKFVKSFIVYCFVVLFTHVALTQNSNQSVFNGSTFSWYAPQSAAEATIFASPQQHPFKFFDLMFDVSEDITETSDNFESDSDHDQPNNYFTLTYFDGSFTKHTSKALIGVQHYLGRYTPFKQAPLFVVFHTWKSHLRNL